LRIAQLNASIAASASVTPPSAEGREWSIDYTQYLTRIRDSGPEGSVVGQALATAMEIQIKRTLDQDVKMSARYIYYAARRIEGTTDADTGAVISDAIGVLAKEGAVEEVVWPYQAGEFAAKPPATVNTATRWLIAEAKSLKGLDAIRLWLSVRTIHSGVFVRRLEFQERCKIKQYKLAGLSLTVDES